MTLEAAERANGSVEERLEASPRRRALVKAAMKAGSLEMGEGGRGMAAKVAEDLEDDLMRLWRDGTLEEALHPHPPSVDDVEEAVGVFLEEVEREALHPLPRRRRRKLASPWQWRPFHSDVPGWRPGN